MITALLSFFGGNVFRMIWGEISAFISKRQEHAQELDRMRLQGELDAARHERNMQSIKTQAELGVKVIEAQREADIDRIEAGAWSSLVEGTTRMTGIGWVDAWNQVIRPALATWSALMITGNYAGFWTLDENGWAICGAALGIYVADRALFKRGK